MASLNLPKQHVGHVYFCPICDTIAIAVEGSEDKYKDKWNVIDDNGKYYFLFNASRSIKVSEKELRPGNDRTYTITKTPEGAAIVKFFRSGNNYSLAKQDHFEIHPDCHEEQQPFWV